MKNIFSYFKKVNWHYCLIFSLIILTNIVPIQAIETQSPKAFFEKALMQSKNGDFDAAISTWNYLLEQTPDDAAALSNRGNVRLALGDPQGAIEDQTQAILLLPLEADPRLNRGIAEELLGKWEDAKKDYEWILEREPNNSLALYNLANVYLALENWTQAEFLFNQAVRFGSGLPIASSSKALIAYQMGDLVKAEAELRKLIRRYPMFADGRAALTALLWKKGFLGEAESNWAAASGLDSRYSQREWLLDVRRWPPQPVADLMAFLALKNI
tara:strand:+ start:633 stop:1445 length:813 start_codon:yes stop_codon:yes gene_type:complete